MAIMAAKSGPVVSFPLLFFVRASSRRTIPDMHSVLLFGPSVNRESSLSTRAREKRGARLSYGLRAVNGGAAQ
jgi:hypothetical protein